MKRRRQPDLIEQIIIGLLKGLWFLVSWPFRKWFEARRPSVFNKEENLSKWTEIEKMLDGEDEIHFKQAIIEADKFFDLIMRKLNTNEGSFADRLRSLEYKMDHNSYQRVWEGHKIRNQISHEMDYKLSNIEAKKALNNFKSGLHNLGAI